VVVSKAGFPKEVKGSDLRDDFAQQHVLMNLQALGDRQHEVMVILSQLRFCDYLGRSSFAAAAHHMNMPKDLGSKYRYCSSPQAYNFNSVVNSIQ
jgi:hypothetical protein